MNITRRFLSFILPVCILFSSMPLGALDVLLQPSIVEETVVVGTNPQESLPGDTLPDVTTTVDTSSAEVTQAESSTPETIVIEPTIAEDVVTTPASAVFDVTWTSLGYSNYEPDVSSNVCVYKADGTDAEEAVISFDGDSYSVTGLVQQESYTISFNAGKDCGYHVVGSTNLPLLYNEEQDTFVTEVAFTAEPDTYDFTYQICVPDGVILPGDMQSTLYCDSIALDLTAEYLGDGIYRYTGLYALDGDYTLELPKHVDYLRVADSSFCVNEDLEQPIVVDYEVEEPIAEFAIYWKDDFDAARRRYRVDLKDMIEIRTVKDDVAEETVFENLTYSWKNCEASDLSGYEKVIYTVEGIPYDLQPGTELKLIWKDNVLIDYTGYKGDDEKIAAFFDEVRLVKDKKAAVYTAAQAYAFELPEYPVVLNITGLNDELLERLISEIRISIYDIYNDVQIPYTDYSVKRNETSILIDNLYETYFFDEGLDTAFYTISWPSKIDEYILMDASSTQMEVGPQIGLFATGAEADTYSIDIRYGAPSFTAYLSGTQHKTKEVIWYDINTNYSHGGQLSLRVPISINGVELEGGITLEGISPTPADQPASNRDQRNWNAATGEYIYSFKKAGWTIDSFMDAFSISADKEKDNLPTRADVAEWLGLNEDGSDDPNNKGLELIVKDQGGNNLNRQMVATIADSLAIDKTQFEETTANYVNINVSLGDNIEIIDEHYVADSDAEIRDYIIGAADIDGKRYTVLYPLAYVNFEIEILTGSDPLPGINGEAGNEWQTILSMIHMQMKEFGVVTDMILARKNPNDSNSTSILDDRLQLKEHYDPNGIFVGNHGDTYTFLLPLFNENKEQIEYALNIRDDYDLPDGNSDDEIDVGNDAYVFRVEYNNKKSAGHGTDLDRAYQNGKLILIRAGQTGFTFHKYWIDDGKSERPQATFELWRYPAKRNGQGAWADYSTSTNVLIPVVADQGTVETGDDTVNLVKRMNIPTVDGKITIPKHLEKYDAEGYPYIYFIREFLPANSGYEKIYGKVDGSGEKLAGTDVLDHPYTQEEVAEELRVSENGVILDNSVYNTGNITNIKTDIVNLSVTKKWVAAYYQDRLSELEVTMKLYRKVASDEAAEEVNAPGFVMSGFDAYNTSQTVGGSFPLYNENGETYEYWWVEDSVVQKSSGTVVSVAESDVPVALEGIGSGSSIGSRYGAASKQFWLPMNVETMNRDSYSPESKEYFESTVTRSEDGTSTVFTNTLKGETEYWVHKVWHESLDPTDVDFPLLQIDADGVSREYEDVFTLKAGLIKNGGHYKISEYDSGWIRGYVDLPKYDEDGNSYTYIAREHEITSILPITSYGKDVDGPEVGEPSDDKEEANSVEVYNAPPGDIFINLRKIWLDDSANTDRVPVKFQVVAYVKADGGVLEPVVLYGPDGLHGDYVELDADSDWIQTVKVTLFQINGEYTTVCPSHVSTEEAFAHVDHYAVTEHYAGSNAVDTDALTQAGYSTVINGSTKYVVIYNDGYVNGDTLINSNATIAADKDEYYTVTNLRIGKVKMGIHKIWQDDGTVDRADYNARVKVICTDDATRLKSDERLGYAKVHPAVAANGWLPIYGGRTEDADTHVDVIQAMPTGQGGTSENEDLWVYYNNLPLYDESGKILQYRIEELQDNMNESDGHYNMIVSPLQYSKDQKEASQYIGIQTITNTFTNSVPINFYLLWLDEYRYDIEQRPDMYLTLYWARYEYDSEGNLVYQMDENGDPVLDANNNPIPKYTIRRHPFREYSWNKEADKVTENFWMFTFENMPQYDEHGRKISYYATVSNHVDDGKIDYLMPQYAIGEVPTLSIFEQDGINQSTVDPVTLAVTHKASSGDDAQKLVRDTVGLQGNPVVLKDENTFVLQLRSNILVQGRKVWEQVPVGFPTTELPLLEFRLKRELTEREANGELGIFKPQLESDGMQRITLAAILDYRSPKLEYHFDMNHMALLQEVDGTFGPVPASENVTYKGKTVTALRAWMDLTGIAGMDENVSNDLLDQAEALYGQPLPKYDSYGTMYTYKVIESDVKPNKEGYEEDNPLGVNVELKHYHNEYKIVNSFYPSARPIEVTKNWFRFSEDNSFDGTKVSNAVYPDMEFRLYRFFRIDNENFDSLGNPTEDNLNALYSDPVLVDIVSLSAAQVKAIAEGDSEKVYAAFSEGLVDKNNVPLGGVAVYAPNGNPYLYVIAEKQIPGFNTNIESDKALFTVTNAVIVPSAEYVEPGSNEKLPHWPTFTEDAFEGYWYSMPFKLNAGNDSSNNAVDTTKEADAAVKNIYTAMEQIPVNFTKVWEDYNNKFSSRPDSLKVTLNRSFTYKNANGAVKMRGPEPIAEVTIQSNGAVSVSWKDGFKPSDTLQKDAAGQETGTYKNLTSTSENTRIQISNTADIDGNEWKLVVQNLDKHAPNGTVYQYSWTEVSVVGYETVVLRSKIVDGEIHNGLKNTMTMNLRVFKEWEENLNSDILKMPVIVELQVKDTSENAVWRFAKDYDGGHFAEKFPEGYEFERELTYPYWYTYFEDLPTGYNQMALSYRVVETKIGDTTFYDLYDFSAPSEAHKVNFSADEVNYSSGSYVIGYDRSTAGTNRVQNNPGLTSITVKKTWEDDSNAYGTRYLENKKWVVSYHIYRSVDSSLNPAQDELVKDASTNEAYVLTITGKNSTSNSDSATLSNLPKYAPDGSEYTYYAVELNPSEDGKSSVGDESNGKYYGGYAVNQNAAKTEFENVLDITKLEVTKNWIGDSGYTGVRPGDEVATSFDPETLTLQMFQHHTVNGKTTTKELKTEFWKTDDADAESFKWTVTQGIDNQWKIIFTGLPKTAPDGVDYTYTVKEKKVPGYQAPTYEQGTTPAGIDHVYVVNNTVTRFQLAKYNEDGSTELKYPVNLKFEGIVVDGYVRNQQNGKITEKKATYILNWWRDDQGIEHYTIKKGDVLISSGDAKTSAEKLDIVGLPEGVYQLTDESTIPNGYYASAVGAKFTLDSTVSQETVKQTVTVDQNSTHQLAVAENTVLLKVINEKTSLSIEKLGVVGSYVKNIPAGWRFSIAGNFADEKGNIYADTKDFVPESNPSESTNSVLYGQLIVGEIYTMKELVNPDGFTRSLAEVKFHLDQNNQVVIDSSAGVASKDSANSNELQFTDKPFQITVTKYRDSDGTKGNKLGGATFRLTDGNGAEIATYVTEADANKSGFGTFTLSSVGSSVNGYSVLFKTSEDKAEAENKNKIYTLQEIIAPSGYILPNSNPYVTFWFNESGEVQVIESQGFSKSGNNFEVLNKPIKLTLLKQDQGDHYAVLAPLANVMFTITEQGSNPVRSATVTTDANGMIHFGPDTSTSDDFMVIGGNTYTLTEVAKNGYELLPVVTFAVKTDGTIGTLNFGDSVGTGIKNPDHKGLTLVNERKLGTVILNKFTNINGENYVLNDAVFGLYRALEPVTWIEKLQNLITGKKYELLWSSDNKSATGVKEVTGPDGTLEIKNLPWGSYELKEIEAPDGFKLGNKAASFTIDADNLSVVAKIEGNDVKNDSFSITISKHRNVNNFANENLIGAVFELQDMAGNLIKTLDCRQNYQIRLDSVEVIEHTDGTKSLHTLLHAAADETTAPHYRLVETKAPAGYILPDENPYVIFWCDLDGDVHVCDCDHAVDSSKDVIASSNQFKFLDKPIELTFVKRDAGDLFDTGKVLADVTFRIKNVKDTGEGTEVATDEKGELTFGPGQDFNVVGGESYTITEVQKEGYEVLSPITFTVNYDGTFIFSDTESVKKTGTTELTAVNDRIPGEVVLKKYTAIGEDTYDLNDAEFSLYRGKKVGNLIEWIEQILGLDSGKEYELIWSSTDQKLGITDENTDDSEKSGELKITNLPWGDYKLVETKAPEGYELPANLEDREHRFMISETQLDASVQITPVLNNSFTFTFTKHASHDGRALGDLLDGAEFMLHEAGSETAIKRYTSADGKIVVQSNGLDENGELEIYMKTSKSLEDASANGGLYRISETKAPAGYILPNYTEDGRTVHPYVEFWIDEIGNFQYVKSIDVKENFKFLDKPIELSLVKYDGGDRFTKAHFVFDADHPFENFADLDKLAGIAFELTGNDGSKQTDSSGVLTFGPSGAFQVVGGVTYTLTELDASSKGYKTISPFTFTVNEDGTIVLPASETPENVSLAKDDNTKLNLVNERIPGKVTLTKHTENQELIDHVVFKLYRYESPDNWLDNIVDFITGRNYVLKATFRWDGSVLDSDGNLTYTDDDGDSGVLHIDGLDWGTYKLVETAASGYLLPADETERTYIFNIGPDDEENDITLHKTLSVMNTTNRVRIGKIAMDDDSRKLLSGAEYDLYSLTVNDDGDVLETKIVNTKNRLAPMWIWNSAEGIGEATCLPVGDYKLVETKSPYGYVIAEPIVFHIDQIGNLTVKSGNADLDLVTDTTETVDENGETGVQIPVIYAKDQLTKFSFTKHELYNETCHEKADASRILPGVTFKAYKDAELTKLIAEAVSDQDGVVTFEGLPLMDYMGDDTRTPVYIKETATVAGHVLDGTVYKAYVDSAIKRGEVVSNSILENVKDNLLVNDVFRADFSFTKVSEVDHTMRLPGAKYGLYKNVTFALGDVRFEREVLVAEAISDERGLVTFKGLLMDTKYTIKELSSPAGYYISKHDVSFQYNWDQTQNLAVLEILDNGKDTLVVDGEKLLWQDVPVQISVLKVKSTGKPLAGAKLQIQDSKGNVIPVINEDGDLVQSWISTDEPFLIVGHLECGEVYWLHELKAPAGYTKAGKMKIKIPDISIEPGEECVIEITLKNYLDNENPQTGDDFNMAEELVLMSASGIILLGLAYVLAARKRRKSTEIG